LIQDGFCRSKIRVNPRAKHPRNPRRVLVLISLGSPDLLLDHVEAVPSLAPLLS
jgi:hypothetical protein